MKLIQRIKQRFCKHIDMPDERNHRMPFLGYSFQCPKCKSYVAYFKNWDEYINISDKEHMLLVEEGKKLWNVQYSQKSKDNYLESLDSLPY